MILSLAQPNEMKSGYFDDEWQWKKQFNSNFVGVLKNVYD
jgi:hypothetical protein